MTSASLARTAELTPPHPTFPLNGAVVDGSAVTFEWQDVPEATGYRLQIAPDRQFARDVLELSANNSTVIAIHDALAPTDRPYFWRVRATTSRGESRWSPYGRFFAGDDARVDAFKTSKEAEQHESRRANARKQVEREAAMDLLPYIERDDTISSDASAKAIGLMMVASFLLVIAAILFATIA